MAADERVAQTGEMKWWVKGTDRRSKNVQFLNHHCKIRLPDVTSFLHLLRVTQRI